MTTDARDAVLHGKVCAYLRTNAEDPTITSLVIAAREYLRNAGVPDGAATESPALYDLAVILHVSKHYNGDDKLDDSLTAMVLQLRS